MTRLLTPLTAACAALAAWSLGVLLLSLFGLGAGFAPHPDDPGLAPPMPEVKLAAIDTRLGPASDYLEVAQRPLLTPDRRPAANAGGDASQSSAPLEAELTGVIISGDVRIALLQEKDGGSRRVRQGELLEGTGWRLQQLEPRRALFVGPEGEKTLDLRVFDGKGGVAPTPVQTAGSSDAKPDDDKPEAVAATPAASPNEAADQQAQVDAIRRRIEARRAQMRAEAAKKAAEKVD